MNQMYNYPFPPVNQTIWLSYKKPQGKRLGISKSHINETKLTIVTLTDTTPVPTTTSHFTKTHTYRSCNTNDQVNEIICQTNTSKNTKSDPQDIKDPHDSDGPDGNLDSFSD